MIGLIILQIFLVSAPPPPTQAEAVRILQASAGLSNVARWPDPAPARGPRIAVTWATGPTLGPWERPAPLPATRLDGSPLWLPPAVYGLPPWWAGLSSGGLNPYSPGRCQNCNQPVSGHKPPGR